MLKRLSATGALLLSLSSLGCCHDERVTMTWDTGETSTWTLTICDAN